MEATDCGICLDPFNAKTRKKICCPYCVDKGAAYCKACIERYLLDDTSQHPRCPNTECRLGWSDDFLSENMTKSYLLNPYKKHREKILLDIERARLPETQPDAARYREAKLLVDPIQTQIATIQTDLKQLPQVVAFHQAQSDFYGTRSYETPADQKRAYDTLVRATNAYRDAVRPYNQRAAALVTPEYHRNLRIVKRFGRQVQTRTDETPRTAWQFVMKCPACEGFVGMDWKCGLCKVEICKECREPMPHECDPEKILTARALQKEAKPCPKCAAQISKIDGCDQMWCTQCKTAFSWRTGEIENHVHNPHYFEWLRRNGGVAPPPDQNAECLTPNEIIDAVLHYNSRHRDLLNWCRYIRHFQMVLRQYQGQVQAAENDDKKHDLRVQRLVGEITDDEWKVALQRMEKAHLKAQRVTEVLELYCQVGTDLLRQSLLESSDKDDVCRQLVELRTYCSQQLEKVRKRFNNEVPVLEIVDAYW